MEEMVGDPTEARRVGTRGLITDFMSRTRTVTPQEAVLEAVLPVVSPVERDISTVITEETGVRKGVKGYNRTPPPPRWIYTAGWRTEQLGRR